MKKLLPIILAFCLILLCACGEKEAETTPHTAPGEEPVFAETVWESDAIAVENISESIFEKPVISTMSTNLDVLNYINTYGTLVDLSSVGLAEKYDDTFFENSCLVVFLVDTSSSTYVPCVDTVDAMGIMTDINVSIEKGDPDNVTTTWLVVVETEKSVMDSDIYVYVY